MSIQRYDTDGPHSRMDTFPDGEYVLYADHVAAVQVAEQRMHEAGYDMGKAKGIHDERARIRAAVQALEWWQDEVLRAESWVSRDLVLAIIDGEDK